MIKILNKDGTLRRLEHPTSEEDGLDPELFEQLRDTDQGWCYEEFCENEVRGKHLERGLLTPLQSDQGHYEVNIGSIIPRWVRLDYSNKPDHEYEAPEEEYQDSYSEQYLVCAERPVWSPELRKVVKGRRWIVTNDLMEVPTEFDEEPKWSKELSKDYHLERIDRPWGLNPLYDELYREQLKQEREEQEAKKVTNEAILAAFLPI